MDADFTEEHRLSGEVRPVATLCPLAIYGSIGVRYQWKKTLLDCPHADTRSE